jgi:tetratricopeptide (TPR) repeat protein/rhodanese-related sulfurtransferase
VTLRQLAVQQKTGDQEARLATLLALARIEPQTPAWQVQLGDTYFALGRYDDAVDAYVDFAKRFPNDALYQDVCFAIANSLGMAKRYRREYDYLLTLPSSPPSWTIRRDCRIADLVQYQLPPNEGIVTGIDEARRILQNAIAQYPDDSMIWQARQQFAMTFLLAPPAGDNARARKVLGELITDYPNNAAAPGWKQSIAWTWANDKKPEQAEQLFRAILNDPPSANSHAAALSGLASVLTEMGRDEEARSARREIVFRFPADGYAEWARRDLGEAPMPESPEEAYAWGCVTSNADNGLRIEHHGPAIWPVPGQMTEFTLSDRSGPIVGAALTLQADAAALPSSSSSAPAAEPKILSLKETGAGRYVVDLNGLGAGRREICLFIQRAGEAKPSPLANGRMCLTLAAARVPRISASNAVGIARTGDAVILDIRDHPQRYVRGARLMPLPLFGEEANQLPKSKLIAVYGDQRNDFDATPAVRRLTALGFRAVSVFGGFDALIQAGCQTVANDP